jgi:hypothetical protein
MSFLKNFGKSLIPGSLDKAGGGIKKVIDSVADHSAPKTIVDAGLSAAGRGLLNVGKRVAGVQTTEQRERNNPAINALLNRLYGSAQGTNITTQQSVTVLLLLFCWSHLTIRHSKHSI